MVKKLRILILEDNVDDALLIQRVLIRSNISSVYECVDHKEEFIDAIHRFRPDVILSDHGLPGFNSREALKISIKERLQIPFILVTGMASDEFAIACIREGADDYILKSNLSRLPIAILAALKKRKLEKLKRNARHALRNQNSALLKVNKELDNFLYSVSHNLRGPIATIMGLLHVAKMINKDKELAAAHEMMAINLSQLENTLREILNHSVNAQKRVAIEIKWLDLIEETFSRISYLQDLDQIDKSILVHHNDQFFSFHERVSTIFTNLLSNSIIFRDDQKKLKIKIEITPTEKEVIILIHDNGIGISEQALPSVFDMFFKGTERSIGDGLGLYITKEIVTHLNGKIELKSTPGIGTTVIVAIPNETDTPPS